MNQHRRIEDLAAGIAEEGLAESGSGVAEGKGAFTERPEDGLNQGIVEKKEIPLVQRDAAKQDRRPEEEFERGEEH
jgi:hypothetical protein